MSIETVDDLLNGEKQNLQERIDRKSRSQVCTYYVLKSDITWYRLLTREL